MAVAELGSAAQAYAQIETIRSTIEGKTECRVDLGTFSVGEKVYRANFGVFSHQARLYAHENQPRLQFWVKDRVVAITELPQDRPFRETDLRYQPLAYRADIDELETPLVSALAEHLSQVRFKPRSIAA